MAMSKKIMERKQKDRKEKIAGLEKLASSGSGEAKKKLAKELKKMKWSFGLLFYYLRWSAAQFYQCFSLDEMKARRDYQNMQRLAEIVVF